MNSVEHPGDSITEYIASLMLITAELRRLARTDLQSN